MTGRPRAESPLCQLTHGKTAAVANVNAEMTQMGVVMIEQGFAADFGTDWQSLLRIKVTPRSHRENICAPEVALHFVFAQVPRAGLSTPCYFHARRRVYRHGRARFGTIRGR